MHNHSWKITETYERYFYEEELTEEQYIEKLGDIIAKGRWNF
ncbi:hypothetical protein [Bacillus cytotoxicus]|nr:hypothetical protein [Bacillus cytotoxicus]